MHSLNAVEHVSEVFQMNVSHFEGMWVSSRLC